jgi:hypothetical protein
MINFASDFKSLPVLQNIPKVCKVAQVMTPGPWRTAIRRSDHRWASDCGKRVLPFRHESHGWHLSAVAMICPGKSPSNPRADRGNAHSPVLRDFTIAEGDPKYRVLSAKERWQIELRDSVIRNIALSTSKSQNRLRQLRGN